MPPKKAAQEEPDFMPNLFTASSQLLESVDETQALQAFKEFLFEITYTSGLLLAKQDRLTFACFRNAWDIGAHEPDEPGIAASTIAKEFIGKRPLYFPVGVFPPEALSGTVSEFNRQGARLVVMIPMFTGEALAGLLVLASRYETGIDARNITNFGHLLGALGQTLIRFHETQIINTRLDSLQRTSQITLNLLFETDLFPLYQEIHRQIKTLMGEVDFIIAIYQAETKRVQIPYAYEGAKSITLDPFPLGEGLTSVLINQNKPILLVKDTEKQANALGARIIGKAAKSWMGVPLSLSGQVIGAIILQDTVNEGRFTEDDLGLLVSMAPQVAAAIRNAQVVSRIRKDLKSFEEERTLLASLLDTIPERVYFKDVDGHYIRANEAVLSDLKVKNLTEIIGKTDFDLMDRERAAEANQEDQAVILSGRPVEQKIEKDTSSPGKEAWFLTTKAPIRNAAGQIIGLVGISREATELVQAQELSKRRAQQMQTAAEIARDVSESRQPDELLARVVNLVNTRFGFYHSSVFLIDKKSDFAVLRESTGEAGRQMKLSGHRLAVGSASIVGQATAQGKPIVANDVTKEASHRYNPLLPGTRAELAIPLRYDKQILGALDVQSQQPNGFTPDDISILEMLSDQLAVAIVNADLYASTQRNLTRYQLLQQVTASASSSSSLDDAIFNILQGLNAILEGVESEVFLYDSRQKLLNQRAWFGDKGKQSSATAGIPLGLGVVGSAALERSIIYLHQAQPNTSVGFTDSANSVEIAIPLIFQQALLGVLHISSSRIKEFNESDQEILGILSTSLGSVISNTHLIEQVQSQVTRQEQLYEIANRIRRSPDMESILKVSASEIGRALGARRAHIEINIQPTQPAPDASVNEKGEEVNR